MTKPRIYLASGWFNEEQKRQMLEIHGVLEALKKEGRVELFAPFFDGIVLKGKQDPAWREKMKEVWDLDIRMLSQSDIVVASTQDHDVGTIFETGYASAKKIPILCYNSNQELGLNVMLAQEARGFIKSQPELKMAIESFCDSYARAIDARPEEWRWNLWEGEPI